MRHTLTAIILLAMALQGVQAQDTKSEEKPGGWDFELPSIRVGKTKKHDIGDKTISFGGSFSSPASMRQKT